MTADASRRSPAGWLGLLVRGMAMGVAEIVPGVSGGTIAFITGIYHEFVRTLAGFGLGSLRLLATAGPVAFWRHHNLSFLLVLAVGMLVSIVLFARLLGHWLMVVPTLVWGFFFGLIVMSVVQIGRGLAPRDLLRFGAIGCLAGLLLTAVDPLQQQTAQWVFFVGGVIAVSAWMLPAVSGSFMLLILGLYQPTIEALNGWRWGVLLSLAAGCVTGVLAFSKALSWMLSRHREPLVATLTGFMAGSVVRLWPWTYDGQLLTPGAYQLTAGNDALVLAACVAAVAGAGAVWLLSRME